MGRFALPEDLFSGQDVGMNSEASNRLEDVFARALELPAALRGPFLARECADAPELCCAVEGLLRASDQAEGFLETGPRPGASVGAWELVEEIGREGFCTVWRARQTVPLVREVAVKMIAPGMDTREVLRRFALERQTLARMKHPGIAQIFDAGADASGRPFFVMELVPGEPLTVWCSGQTLPLAERLQLFRGVCAAVAYAHQRGVIHRDLKPSNILASAEGVKVIDFGIARVLEAGDGSARTMAGQIAGTPAWMPPEAFTGGAGDVRADVFALGLLLCELATGAPARDAAAWHTASLGQWASLAAQPVRARRLKNDLDAVIACATALEPAARYASVVEMMDDVRAFGECRPVRARPPSWWYLTHRFVQRHRLGAGAAVVALTGIAGGGVVAWQQKMEAEFAARRSGIMADMLERAIFSANPERGLPEGYTLGQWLEDLSQQMPPEARADPYIEHRLQRSLGDAWMGRSQPERAAPHHARAGELARQLYGPQSREAANAAYALGNLATNRRQADEAISHFTAAAAIFGSLPDQDGAAMAARSRLQLSLNLLNAGRTAEAESAARRTIGEAEAGHPEILPRALWALGRVHAARRDWAALEPLAQRRSDAQRALTGDDAPETWEAEAFLAESIAHLGRRDEAKRRLDAVLDRQRVHFGPGHATVQATEATLRELAAP